VEALTEPMKERTRAVDKLHVKGRAREVDIYEVLWRQSEELTSMVTQSPSPPQQPRVQLRLRHGGRETIVDQDRGLVNFGREGSSDIVIADRKASREHARIERRRDKFVLVDVSFNGTFVTFYGEPEMAVKREEVVLHGHGSISFGHPYNADTTEVAAFEVETLN
jgi:adenylate cyclase